LATAVQQGVFRKPYCLETSSEILSNYIPHIFWACHHLPKGYATKYIRSQMHRHKPDSTAFFFNNKTGGKV
jgi:hypothetical protein